MQIKITAKSLSPAVGQDLRDDNSSASSEVIIPGGWREITGCIHGFGLFVVAVFLFRAAPLAYGRFQARGQIGAVAANLCHSHSNMGSKLPLRPTSQRCWILNPLSEARDRTLILMDGGWVRYY